MKNEQLQLVNFEQAKRLKEAGFDWKTHKGYDLNGHKINLWTENFGLIIEHYKAPEKSLVLKWIRDTFQIYCTVSFMLGAYCDYIGTFWHNNKVHHTKLFKSYEAAESALLTELLNLLTPKP